jgi:hypothetical protein
MKDFMTDIECHMARHISTFTHTTAKQELQSVGKRRVWWSSRLHQEDATLNNRSVHCTTLDTMDIEVVLKPNFRSDNYYEVLGCTSSASDNTLTKAYRDLSRKVCRLGSRLSMVWRPTRCNGSPLPPCV